MHPDRVARKKYRRRRARPALPPPRREETSSPPPSTPDYELDIAPELVTRGPDEERDRLPVCSLPHEDV
jgi:hypothetical protein